jgi:magnesium-transporting ATPase (P-type)
MVSLCTRRSEEELIEIEESMTQTERLNQLRELFLLAPESETTRFLAIGLSLALVVSVLWLVRIRALREEYTPIWIGVAAALVIISLRLDVLQALTRALGAWAVSSTIFFMGEVFLVIICLNYAVRLSRTTLQLKNLAQEVALLRARLDRITEASSAS